MESTQYTSKITLFEGVPFGPDLNDTLTPGPLESKLGWLKSQYTNHEIINIQMLKPNKGSGITIARLSTTGEIANNVNYAYIHDNRGGEYFAFINGSRYINDGEIKNGEPNYVFEFTMTIDPMMTYLLKDPFKQCSIKRHGVNDAKWKNDIVETIPFGTGQVYTHDVIDCIDAGINLDDVFILVGLVPNGTAMKSTFVNRVPNGLEYVGMTYHPNADQFINQLIEMMDDPEQIKGIWLCPCAALSDSGQDRLTADGVHLLDSDFNNSVKPWAVYTAAESKKMGKTGEYTAVYGKTHMYPYHYAKLFNGVGDEMPLKFEEWNLHDGSYNIGIDVTALPPSIVKAGPQYYDCDIAHGKPIAHNDRCSYKTIQVGGYPQGSWAIDNWYTYQAQNEHSLRAQYVSGFINTCASLFGLGSSTAISADSASREDPLDRGDSRNAASRGTGGNVVSAGINFLSNFLTTQVRNTALRDDLGNMADAVHGCTNASWSDWVHFRMNIMVGLVSVSAAAARHIDEYFEKYGYDQAGKVDTPDPAKVAKRYCFVQTMNDCFDKTKCKCSQAESSVINTAMKAGVTFWGYTNNTADSILKFDDPAEI